MGRREGRSWGEMEMVSLLAREVPEVVLPLGRVSVDEESVRRSRNGLRECE